MVSFGRQLRLSASVISFSYLAERRLEGVRMGLEVPLRGSAERSGWRNLAREIWLEKFALKSRSLRKDFSSLLMLFRLLFTDFFGASTDFLLL